jgi:ribosomal protein L30/L7E
MIAIIRIKGQPSLDEDLKGTFERLNLRKKYHCIVIENPGAVELGMIKKVKDLVAYGEISEDTYEKLKKIRGYQGEKYFRLSPPRGGIDSKKPFGKNKGVLGDNKEKINQLILRML